jgi:hypothetical protein
MSDENTIDFTLGELKNIEESIKKLLNSEIPIKISYRLSKIVNKLSAELSLLEEHRVVLVKKYGETVEGTDGIKVSKDKMPLFIEDYNSLLQESVSIPFTPISVDSLGDNLNFSPLDMVNLQKFFIE